MTLTTPIVDPLGPEGAVASALSRNVEPFLASALGYDTVQLTWSPPVLAGWLGIQIVRSRSGFPRSTDDGLSVLQYEHPGWNEANSFTVSNLGGGYHYFSLFLKDAFGWTKVTEQDVLVPYDYNSIDRMWDTIPNHYKVIRDDTADISLVNLRINADLYDNVAGGSAPNDLLSAFISLFGWEFDTLRTQVEYLKQGYDPTVIHPSRLRLLSQQFGHEPEVAVPAHVNRTIVRNLASLYRSRGTSAGIKDIVTAVTGWEADIYIGYNRVLSNAQSHFINPSWPEWDPTVRYPAATLVKRNNWIYLSLDVNLGDAQAPPTTATSNARWQYTAWPVFYPPLNGDVGPWQVRMNGVADNGYIAGYTRVASGVPDPSATSKLQYNALMVFRDTASGTNGATWVDVFSVPGIGSGASDKERIVKYGIPVPQGLEWQVGRTYRRGEVVKYGTTYWEVLVDHVGETPPESVSGRWGDAAADDISRGVPMNLSFVSHGPFVGANSTNGRLVRARVRTYDGNGVLLDDLSGLDATPGAINNGSGTTPWVAYDFHFQPHADAKFLAIGARIESLQQATTSNTWEFAHYFTNFQLEVSADDHAARGYQSPRQVQIVVEPDRTNHVINPSFEVNASGWQFSGATGARSTAQAAVGAASLALTSTGTGSVYTRPSTDIPVTAGKTYTASAYVRAGSVSRLCRVQLNWLDASSALISAVQPTLVSSPTSEWLRLSAAGEAPANATALRMLVYPAVSTSAVGEVYYVDAVMVTEGSELQPYFDGASGDDYVWASGGTAHNAKSAYYENRLDRTEAIRRALRDAVPVDLSIAEPLFAYNL